MSIIEATRLCESQRNINSRVIKLSLVQLLKQRVAGKEVPLKVILVDGTRWLYTRVLPGQSSNIINIQTGLKTNELLGPIKVPNLQLYLPEQVVSFVQYRFIVKDDSIKVVPLVATRNGFEGRGYGSGLLTAIDHVVNSMQQIYPSLVENRRIFAQVEDVSRSWDKRRNHTGWTSHILEEELGYRSTSYAWETVNFRIEYQ